MCKVESRFLMESKEIINIINNIYYKISCFPAVTITYEVLLTFNKDVFYSLTWVLFFPSFLPEAPP